MKDGSGLSFRANAGWTLAGRLIYGACQAGILMLLAKLGTVREVGQFALALAVTAPVMVFANLQLRSLLATEARDGLPFAAYLRLRRYASAAGFVVIATIGAVGPFSSGAAAAIVIVGGAKAIETVLDLGYGVFQRHGRLDYYGQSLALRSVGGLGAMGALLYATRSAEAALLGMGAAWLVVLLAVDRPRVAGLTGDAAGQRYERGALLRLVAAAIPMGGVMLLDSLTQNVQRYTVEALLGEAMLGFYASMAYVVTAAGVFVFAASAPVLPALARFHGSGDRRRFIQLSGKLLGASIGLGLAGVLFAAIAGELFLRTIYTPAYGTHAPTFVWIMVGGGLHFVVGTSMLILTAARVLKIQPVAHAAALVVTLGLCLHWIPSHGLRGAALAAVAGGLIALAIAATAVARLLLRWR